MPGPLVPMRHRQQQRHPSRPRDVDRRLHRQLHALKPVEHVRHLLVAQPNPWNRAMPGPRRLPPNRQILVVRQHPHGPPRNPCERVGQYPHVPDPTRDRQSQRCQHGVHHVRKAAVHHKCARLYIPYGPRDPRRQRQLEHGRGAQPALRHDPRPLVARGGDHAAGLHRGSLHHHARMKPAQQVLWHARRHQVGRMRLEPHRRAEDGAPRIGGGADIVRTQRVAPSHDHPRRLSPRSSQIERDPGGESARPEQ